MGSYDDKKSFIQRIGKSEKVAFRSNQKMDWQSNLFEPLDQCPPIAEGG